MGERALTSQLRASLLSAAAFFGDAGTVAWAAALYAGRAATPIPLDFASLVLNSVVRSGGEAEWTQVQAAFEAATSATDARRYLLALAATRSRALLARTLAYALTPAVRVGDKVSLVTSVAANAWGRDLAWAWATTNWATLTTLCEFARGRGGARSSRSLSPRPQPLSSPPPMLTPSPSAPHSGKRADGSGGFDLSNLVGTLGGVFTTAEWGAKVKAFWGPGGSAAGSVSGAIHDFNAGQETIGRAVLWEASEAPATCAFLHGGARA